MSPHEPSSSDTMMSASSGAAHALPPAELGELLNGELEATLSEGGGYHPAALWVAIASFWAADFSITPADEKKESFGTCARMHVIGIVVQLLPMVVPHMRRAPRAYVRI